MIQLQPGVAIAALPTEADKGRDGRSRETRIPTTDPNVFLVLSTFHYGDRKTFVSQVMGVRILPGSWICSPMDAVTVTKTPVARFSAKSADAAHAEALAFLAQDIESGRSYQGVLDATPED